MKRFISILLAVLIVTAMFAVSMVSAFAAEPTSGGIDDDMNRGRVTVLNNNDVLDNANDDDVNGGGTVNDGQTNGNNNVTDNARTDTDVITNTKSDAVTPENTTEVVTATPAEKSNNINKPKTGDTILRVGITSKLPQPVS